MAARIAGQCLIDAASPVELPRAAERAVRQSLSTVSNPSLLLCFVGGVGHLPSDALFDVSRAVTALSPHSTRLVIETSAPIGTGVEREGKLAVSVFALDQSAAKVSLQTYFSTRRFIDTTLPLTDLIGDTATPRLGEITPALSLAFFAADAHHPKAIEFLSERAHAPLLGGGCISLLAGSPDSDTVPVSTALITIVSTLGVATVSSPACRVITPWVRVDQTDEQFIVTTDHGPALELFSRSNPTVTPKEPVLIAVQSHDGVSPPLVHTITGIDSHRGAVGLSESVPVGAMVALAARDAEAARTDLYRRLNELSRKLHGADPAAGLLLTSTGRGLGLYRRRDVDAGLFRARFGDLPVSGMQSAFALAPWGHDGRARTQRFTAVAAVFFRRS